MYQFILTSDLSPTLIWESEAMHNKAGAYSETQYIYGDALRKGAEQGVDFSVFILGLGLGYIELLVVAEFLSQKKDQPISILTAESDSFLVQEFILWLSGKPSEMYEAYEGLYAFFLKDYGQLPIKEKLYQMHLNGNWRVMGSLSLESIPSEKFGYIFYDAFSSKSTPELWTQEFLNAFFKKCCGNIEKTVFATYACKGLLKRILESFGFQVTKKPGFSGKRDSTLAVKS